MSNKIDAAVVVLYNPEPSVRDNIATYVNHVNRLFVIDNSTRPHDLYASLGQLPFLKVIHSGSNIGISKALNLALKHAKQENCRWVMTMDQDSFFDKEQLEKYIDDFLTVNVDNTAIVSPLHNQKFIQKHLNDPFRTKEIVMTSANLVNVELALKTGGYDENLFIDEVDHAFCLSLHQPQYNILENQTVFVHHMLGMPYKKNSDIKLYSPTRIYYMSRNYLYVRKRYRTSHKMFFKKRDKYLISFFMKQFMYGDQKFKNFQMFLKGLADYCYKRFGKLHED